MTYVRRDYPTKKALKEAVAQLAAAPADAHANPLRRDLTVIQTSVSQDDTKLTRTVIEGPHYPKPHSWYASVLIKDGVVVKVLS